MNGSRNRNDGQTMSVLFTMLLFLVFIMCALFTVLAGSKVYENISSRMDQTYTGSVALQYVANKVRQGDADKAVAVKTEDGQPVLEIRETIEGGDYITWIYYYEGSIRKLFTYEDSGLGLADGLEILACDGLTITQDGQLLHVTTLGTGGGSLTLSLRSGRTVTGQ